MRCLKPRAHFLHIGKAGGTAVIEALKPLASAGRYQLELHHHGMSLPYIRVGEPFFFVVRDPIDRFISGFYSRQRKGRPRYHVEWTAEEAEAFQTFTTANDLGEGLAWTDAELRGRAQRAMQSITHVNDTFWRTFVDESYFRSRARDLLYVADQASLNADFHELGQLLGLGDRAQLPQDAAAAHRTPSNVDRRISAEASNALTQWYRRDYRFLAVIGDVRAERGGAWGRMRSDGLPHRTARLGHAAVKKLVH